MAQIEKKKLGAKENKSEVTRNRGFALARPIAKRLHEYIKLFKLSDANRKLLIHVIGSYMQGLEPDPINWEWVHIEYSQKASLKKLFELGLVNRIDLETGLAITYEHTEARNYKTYSIKYNKAIKYQPSQEILDIIFSFELEDYVEDGKINYVYFGSFRPYIDKRENDFRGLPQHHQVVQLVKRVQRCPINLEAVLERLKTAYLNDKESRFKVDYRSFKSILERGLIKEGKFWTYQPIYSIANTGRPYELGSGSQSCTNEFKAALFKDSEYHNYDLVSSQLNILKYYFEKYSIKCSLLDDIESLKAEGTKHFGKAPWKSCIYSLIFDASTVKRYKDKAENKWKFSAIFKYLNKDDIKWNKFKEIHSPLIKALRELDKCFRKELNLKGGAYVNPCEIPITIYGKELNEIERKELRAFNIQGEEVKIIGKWIEEWEEEVISLQHDGYVGRSKRREGRIEEIGEVMEIEGGDMMMMISNKSICTNQSTLKPVNASAILTKKLAPKISTIRVEDLELTFEEQQWIKMELEKIEWLAKRLRKNIE